MTAIDDAEREILRIVIKAMDGGARESDLLLAAQRAVDTWYENRFRAECEAERAAQ